MIRYTINLNASDFEWDVIKDIGNRIKHGVSFAKAQHAFDDPRRVIEEDIKHSEREWRYYCYGAIQGGIMTVRFTERTSMIRIIGAGYWRKGRELY